MHEHLGSEALPLWRLHRYVKFLADLFAKDRLRIVTGFLKTTDDVNAVRYNASGLSQLSVISHPIYQAIY